MHSVMDTTCFSAVLLVLAALSATSVGETETTTTTLVTTTVAPTTPAPMKESSNEVPETSADKRALTNMAADYTTTATPMVPLEPSPGGTDGPPPTAEEGSSTDSRNTIGIADENDKINDISSGKFSKQDQLENAGSTSTETSLGTTFYSAVSNEHASEDTARSATRGRTGSLAADIVTEPPAEPSGAVLSKPINDSGDVSTSDSPVSPTATDLSTLTSEVTSLESSVTGAPPSYDTLNTEHGSSIAELYPSGSAVSATEQQNSADTTTGYTDTSGSDSVPNIEPVITNNPTEYADTNLPAVDTDVVVPVVPTDYTQFGLSGLYTQDTAEGGPSVPSGLLEEHQSPNPGNTMHATPADHVQHADATITPPSAEEASSPLTHTYGPSTVLPGQNTENQSQATPSETPLDLAPSEKTTQENPETEADRSRSIISPGGATTLTGEQSDATSTSVTHLSDVTVTPYSATVTDANNQTQPTDTTASRPFEETSPAEVGAGATTETTLSDSGSPFTTSESTPTTTQHSANTAKMGRSNDLESTDFATHDAIETSTNPTTVTPAATAATYSTREEETPKPEQETSTLPSSVSAAETTRSDATTTASPPDSSSSVTTTEHHTEATTLSVPDSVSSGPVDLYTPAFPDNTQTTTFAQPKETAESATTTSATTPPVDATTTVSSGTAMADLTVPEEHTELKTSVTPPSTTEAHTEAVTPQAETTNLPLQGGAEGTTNEGTTAPADMSTQEATRVFEGSRTGQYTETVPVFSAQSTTQSPDVSVTEETTAHYTTEEPTETSVPSEGQNTETVESKSPVEGTTQEPTSAPTTEQSTEVPTESSSGVAANGLEINARTEGATEDVTEMQTTAVPVTKEPTETSETSTTEHATTAQPSFETTTTVVYEEPTTTLSPESTSPEGSQPTSEVENEATEQTVSSVTDSGIPSASSASRSPKQLSESTSATTSDGTTPPFTEQDHQHSFTTAPDLFPTTQVHTAWSQPATESVSTEEAPTQGATEQTPWTRLVTTAAATHDWDTTTDLMVPSTGSTNTEETAATPIDASCEIVDGSLPVSCLLPEELNHTVTVKFADLNRTRAETFRTEARIWLQEHYRKKGMQLADPAVVFLSGDRGMDLISFFVVNRTRGSVVPGDAVVAVLNNMKLTFEDKLGTVITDVFYGLPIVQKKGVGVAGFLGSQLGLVYVIVGASLAALLLLALLVVIMVKCRTLSANQYSPDSEKLTKDLQMRAEMGDLRPGEEILKEEAQLKEALNGNGTHINGDGWVVPYSQIVNEHKSPADAQDTRL